MAFSKPTVVDDDGTSTTGTVYDAAFFDDYGNRIDAAIDGATSTVRPVSKGGTGASTLTGVLKGNGTLPFTASPQLAVADGGTGVATLTDKGIVYGNGTSPVGVTAVGAAGQVLTSNGAGVAPTFQATAGGGTFTEQTTALTGAQANFSLSANLTYLRCTGAAPIFSGFTVGGAAPAAGARVLIECLGTTAKVTKEDAGSTAANRVITPSTTGQIIGGNGLMELIYDATTLRWREHLIDPGLAIAVAYAAGDYTASGTMTFTVEAGDLTVYTYRQLGTTLEVSITIVTATTGGTASTSVRAALPGFTLATGTRYSICYLFNAGANAVGYVAQLSGLTYMEFRRLDAANFTLETNLVYVGFSGLLPIT